MDIQKISKVITKFTGRSSSLFYKDLKNQTDYLKEELGGANVLVIGGAGTIGSSYIDQILKFPIRQLIVVDQNENGLAELIRNIRSRTWEFLPEIITYPVRFGDEIFKEILIEHGPFEIVANFAAHKHVRTEKNIYAVKAMFRNNIIFNIELLKWLTEHPPKHFFCVSTDKASDPVNIMGASKKLMEEIMMTCKNQFKISTSRFANVAFSNGSLLQSYINRYERLQPLVCPIDIKRFFVSGEESGQLCLLANICANSGDIFVPKLYTKDLISFPDTLRAFLDVHGLKAVPFSSEVEVRKACDQIEYFLNKKEYPVYFFRSDTTGEKFEEQFYGDNETVEMNRFHNIAVVKPGGSSLNDMMMLYDEGKWLVETASQKADFISFFQKWLPGFSHLDKGKYLDDKM